MFYSEGDYVHDMDLGFYDAYQRSGGERWKETASYPPMHQRDAPRRLPVALPRVPVQVLRHGGDRLPEEFRGAPNGHEGSHHFLVDDFVKAVNSRALPPVSAWTAARFTLPGIVAHESACRNGERLPIRDFGDAPASL